jgi:hypothetical protein
MSRELLERNVTPEIYEDNGMSEETIQSQDINADFRSPKSINILGLLEKLTGTGRPPGDSATKE